MDLKNELENEVLLAILTQKRNVKGIDGEDSRALVSKIKGALKMDEKTAPAANIPLPTTDVEYLN